jgi:8-oxo-dGTP diphosphatase
MTPAPGILARGPWDPEQVEVSWRSDEFAPAEAVLEAADAAIEALRRRGSPSHDGLAARLADFQADPGRLNLELQPVR